MSQRPYPVLYLAEPPAHYLARAPAVVDCSALAGLLFQEAWCDLAAEKIHGRSLHAPFLLPAEIASVALKKHRKGFAELAADALAPYAVNGHYPAPGRTSTGSDPGTSLSALGLRRRLPVAGR